MTRRLTFEEKTAKKAARQKRDLSGPNSNSWKGGRTLSAHGYVLVKVGKSHHLADHRGYAYEHRLVAEKILGRRLRTGEVPHHIDHDKANNDPSNIEVCSTRAHHGAAHRKPGSKRRLMGQQNPIVACRCGCGREFRKFDDDRRPRLFVPGHNLRCNSETGGALRGAGGAA